MKPILFTIGDFNIYGYGVMYALSLIVGLFLAEYRAKKHGLDHEFTFMMGFIAVIIGVLGAKLLYLITIFDELMADFGGTLKRSISEGFVVYGGVIAAALFAYFYCKKKGYDPLKYFDIAAPSIAIGHTLGRIGCYLAGCCYGIKTDAFYGVTFPAESAAPSTYAVVPIQLISSFLCLIMFIILLVAYRKFKHPGQTFSLYMILYGVGRFVIEFFRADYRGEVGIFSTSQFISLFVVALGIFLMVYAIKKNTSK